MPASSDHHGGHHAGGHGSHKSHGSTSGGVHGLLHLPDHGERFEEEWTATKQRIERVGATSVPREAEPSGAPRLYRGE